MSRPSMQLLKPQCPAPPRTSPYPWLQRWIVLQSAVYVDRNIAPPQQKSVTSNDFRDRTRRFAPISITISSDILISIFGVLNFKLWYLEDI
ncbi:hypothetical protein EVAR_39974_1 [Eumeta japonica]|uniref:Uncharacterized protein n=1 Tax=Eumeta variegata TaxID=151549 RepID=A0A4C1YDW1_EUMVA|nr:hypothetical protein EVAR_39974_1 [Eumeta japonica]